MEPLSIEATAASITSISHEVFDKGFNPLAFYFTHSAPASIIDREAYFECTVFEYTGFECAVFEYAAHFETDRDALLISHQSLSRPIKIADHSIFPRFDAPLYTEPSSTEEDSSFVQYVRSQISQFLHEGAPTILDTARQLGMSGRTLQRRLSEQGYSFQSLVNELRRQLSERLLADTNHSLAEIAFMTGYSEQSAFTRAFKRWTGQTPRSYRLNA